MSEPRAQVRRPSIEQYVFALRLNEAEGRTEQTNRQRALGDLLKELGAHFGALTGQTATWELAPRQTLDPYVSQPLGSVGWLLGADTHNAYLARARTYSDGYMIHARYLRKGDWPLATFGDMARNDVWPVLADPGILGQLIVLAAVARPEDSHAIAAQALRVLTPPRRGIGTLQSCGFGHSRILQGSLTPDYAVFVYDHDDLEWGVDTFLARWLPRWEFHFRKLDRQMGWCESLYSQMEGQAQQLRQAIRDGKLPEADSFSVDLHRSFSERLTVWLRHESAIQANLQNLRWLLSELPVVGPDTFFASDLRRLRTQAQELTSRLVGWQRTRDEAGRSGLPPTADSRNMALPMRGDLSRLWLNSQQPTPVLSSLRTGAQMSGWPGRGWVSARAIHFPDEPTSVPRWLGRRYDLLHLGIQGPLTGRGYAVTVTSSVLGQFAGTLTLPDSEMLDDRVDAIISGRPAGAASRNLGERLFRMLMGLDREMIYRRALALARATGHGLALRLTISNAPELESLPWECLYDPGEDVHLAASAETPFARALAGPPPPARELVQLPLRILLAVAVPQDAGSRFGLNSADSAQRAQTLQESLSQLVDAEHLTLETIAGATRAGILETITRFQPSVVCILADAVMRRNTPQLLLETPMRGSRLASARALSALVRETSARVVLLLPADAGSASSTAALGGVARRLVAEQSCAVIVQQHASNADAFFPEVCRTMASGAPLDAAVSEARRRLLMEGNGENKGWEAYSLMLPTLSADILRPETMARTAATDRGGGER